MRRESAEMRAEMNKIFWAADSTVQTNDYTTYPQTGIGQVFPLFVKPEYQVCNHAKNGRSTKSFMDEGRLKAIEEKIGAGDFLFIQFGHKQTAEKNNVPLVDLYSMSRMELKKAGEKNSRRWYMFFPEGEYKNHPEKSEDNTHLRYDGAVNFASLIARGLREIGGIYAELLLDDLKL